MSDRTDEMVPSEVASVLGTDAVHCVECSGWHHRRYHETRVVGDVCPQCKSQIEQFSVVTIEQRERWLRLQPCGHELEIDMDAELRVGPSVIRGRLMRMVVV